MAETTIRLITDSNGQQKIVVDHKSDPDALSHEHEKEHKDIVNSLVGKDAVKTRETNDGLNRAPEKPHEVDQRETVKN